ncbi:MAG: lysylphosphatidylglycerol synthase transmembrane domain-containing protein [candidate division KSB1 bacterium]|nr:lysylphosphatidylglycerol synthase transmembrane domain-containing protein [candidate division KSB1 bacterium]
MTGRFFKLNSRSVLCFFKILISGVILFVLVQKISLSGLLRTMTSAEPLFVGAAFLLLPLNLLLQFGRWKLVVRRLQPDVKSRMIWSSLFIGISMGLATPARLGDYARTLFVRDVDKPQLLGLFVVDKVITWFVIYLLGALGLLQFIPVLTRTRILMLVMGLGALFLVIAVVAYRRGFHVNPDHGKSDFLGRLLAGVGKMSRTLIQKLAALSFIQVLTYCTQFYLLILAFDSITFFHAMSAAFAVMFIKTVFPLSFGDLGTREGAAIYFFGRFDVSSCRGVQCIAFIVFDQYFNSRFDGYVCVSAFPESIPRESQCLMFFI